MVIININSYFEELSKDHFKKLDKITVSTFDKVINVSGDYVPLILQLWIIFHICFGTFSNLFRTMFLKAVNRSVIRIIFFSCVIIFFLGSSICPTPNIFCPLRTNITHWKKLIIQGISHKILSFWVVLVP